MRNRRWKLICRALCSLVLSLPVCLTVAYHHGDRQLLQVGQRVEASDMRSPCLSRGDPTPVYATPPLSFSFTTFLHTFQKHNRQTQRRWNRCTQSIIIIHLISHNSQILKKRGQTPYSAKQVERAHIHKVSETKISTNKKKPIVQ